MSREKTSKEEQPRGFLSSLRAYFGSEKGLSSVSAAAGVLALLTSLADLVLHIEHLPAFAKDLLLPVGIGVAALVVAALIYHSKGD